MNTAKKIEAEKVDNVYKTDDYSMFKVLNGNRRVLVQRKNLILKSIKERGWIRNPIIVNEKMEMIDGQGRFEALKDLNLPIEFVVAYGATIDDCIALNIKQKNWSLVDYIYCYADNGYKDYKYIVDLMQRYNGKLNNSTIVQIAGSTRADNIPYEQIKNGTYKIMDRDTVTKRLDFIIEMLSIIGKKRGRERLWTNTFKFVYYSDVINKRSMLQKLNARISEVHPVVTTEQAVLELEKVYNFGRNEKLFFMPEYDKYMRMCKNI